MKFCTHCGKQVLDDAIICPGCGCSVQYDNKTKTTSAQPTATPVYSAPVNDTYSPLSIAGFVCSFFTTIVGLILSIVAYNEAKRTGSQKSKSMSTAGIVISSIALGLAVFGVLIWVILIIAAISSGAGGYY